MCKGGDAKWHAVRLICLLILIFQEQAYVVLRIRKIIFFGTVFLCGVDPPVLKLQKFDSGFSEYVSVVQSSSQGSPSSLHEEDQVSIFFCQNTFKNIGF